MTKGKAGHYWQRTIPPVPPEFTPYAVVLTGSGSYAMPSGATYVKVWAIGNGNRNGAAGGTAYKTWSSQEGSLSVSYSAASTIGGSSTAMCQDATITGYGPGFDTAGGGYADGDGGANGGRGGYVSLAGATLFQVGGAVGGNGVTSGTPSAAWNSSIYRMPAADVSGLLAAVALAGVKAVEDGNEPAAFGSGCADRWIDGDEANTRIWTPGLGGGGRTISNAAGRGFTFIEPIGGAVVLYFY